MTKRSCELVIHIISVGEISFIFYFAIFPHLQFTAGELKISLQGVQKFHCADCYSPVFILANINLFGSLVSAGFLLIVCS